MLVLPRGIPNAYIVREQSGQDGTPCALNYTAVWDNKLVYYNDFFAHVRLSFLFQRDQRLPWLC